MLGTPYLCLVLLGNNERNLAVAQWVPPIGVGTALTKDTGTKFHWSLDSRKFDGRGGHNPLVAPLKFGKEQELESKLRYNS